MSNHHSHAALPYPIRGARYTIPIPYLDADGDPTDPTTPDTEISKDAGSFADCTEEVSTISGSNGMGYITLTSTEMDASLVCIAAKVASGPKATLAMLQPRILPVIGNGTAQAGGNTSITLASSAPAYDLTGCFVRTTGGTGGGSGANQARVITAYNVSTKEATVSPAWETNPDSTTTYDVLLSDLAVNNPVNTDTDTLLSRIIGTLASGTHNPQSGDAYSRIGANGAGLTAIGDTRLNHLDADVSSRSSHSAADVWAVTTRTLSSFGTLVSDIATAVWSAGTRTLSGFGSLVADVATAVWGAVARTITGGTVDTCTTNSDMRGTNGALLAANYTAPNNSGITDIKAKTDQLTFTTANKVDATATVSVAGLATEAKQDEIISDIAGVITHGDANWLTPSGIGGTIAVTFNVKDDSGHNILDAVVEVWDTAGTTLKERKETNSSGNAVFNCKAEAYTIKITKAGYSFTDASYTVSVPATVNYVMTAFVIPVSPDLTKCRVWMKLINTYTSLTVTADVPENLTGNNLVMGNYTGVYDTVNNLVYWDLPIGAVNSVLKITELGFEVVVPLILDLESSELKDLI